MKRSSVGVDVGRSYAVDRVSACIHGRRRSTPASLHHHHHHHHYNRYHRRPIAKEAPTRVARDLAPEINSRLYADLDYFLHKDILLFTF